MVRKPLPDPVTPTDRYLHDIATSLRALTSDDGARAATGEQTRPDAVVRLREPADDVTCPTCGFEAKTPGGLAAHRRSH